MRKLTCLVGTLLVTGGLIMAAPPARSFTGKIGDSMCGAKHMMPGESDKDCTLDCVKHGAKYILVDSKGKIIN